eukprot:scaffold2136_cov242-Pinguiococcus_pyrenoidosus.AAC.13
MVDGTDLAARDRMKSDNSTYRQAAYADAAAHRQKDELKHGESAGGPRRRGEPKPRRGGCCTGVYLFLEVRLLARRRRGRPNARASG